MSADQKRERTRIEEAIRGAFEAVLPSLIDEVLARLDGMPSNRPRPARAQDLGPLFDAARSGGETAVRVLLDRPIEDLRSIARALDRHLGDSARRWKDVIKMQDAITAEILRRAWRNDVFLSSGHTRGSATDDSHDKNNMPILKASQGNSTDTKHDPQRADLTLTLNFKSTRTSGERHYYELVTCVKNTGRRRIEDWHLEIEFPTRLLDGIQQATLVPDRSNRDRTLFRVDGRTINKPLGPGDEQAVKIGYYVDSEIFDKQHVLFEKIAVARVLVDGVIVAQVERPIRELQNF